MPYLITTTLECDDHLNLSLCENGPRERWEGRRDRERESRCLFLTRVRDFDSEEEENEGVNRSDYQGGLMVPTIPI